MELGEVETRRGGRARLLRLQGQPPLTVVSSGGAYTRSQMLAFVRPYRLATGRWVGRGNP